MSEQQPLLQPFLRDRLLAADAATPTADYERKMSDLLEGKLFGPRKIALLGSAAFTLAAGAVFVWLATRAAPPLPAAARGGLGFGAACCLVWTVAAFRTYRAGVFHRRRHLALFTRIPTAVLLVTGILLIVLGIDQPDLNRAVRAGFLGTLFVIGAAQFLLQHVVEQSELRTRERLLELQLQVAELRGFLATGIGQQDSVQQPPIRGIGGGA